MGHVMDDIYGTCIIPEQTGVFGKSSSSSTMTLIRKGVVMVSKLRRGEQLPDMGHVMEDICVTGIRPEQTGVFGKSSSSSSSTMTLIRKGVVMTVMPLLMASVN